MPNASEKLYARRSARRRVEEGMADTPSAKTAFAFVR
jgi:hypothetical protein